MSALCRHCSTPIQGASSVDGFCCAGCREVYALIREEGLDEYYRKQDRMAEPLKDRTLSSVDHAALRETQQRLEASGGAASGVFSVSGLSCMGCVWLIERLAERQSGSLEVQVSLTRQSLGLTWQPERFDLGGLAEELRRFGYHLDAKPLPPGLQERISPLALRTQFSLIFTGNAFLLVYAEDAMGASLAELLGLGCFVFTGLIGALPFFQAVYRAAQIRRWHSDLVPSLFILGLLAWLGFQVSLGELNLTFAGFIACFSISIFVLARYLAARINRRSQR